MKEKIYRCIEHGVISEFDVIFEEKREGQVTNDPKEDIFAGKGVTAQHRYHKNCGQPVEEV